MLPIAGKHVRSLRLDAQSMGGPPDDERLRGRRWGGGGEEEERWRR